MASLRSTVCSQSRRSPLSIKPMQQLDNFEHSALLAAVAVPASLAIIMLGIAASVVLLGGIEPAADGCMAGMFIGALVETGARIGASGRAGAVLVVLVSVAAAVCGATFVDVAAFVEDGGGGAVPGAHALSDQTRQKLTAILRIMLSTLAFHDRLANHSHQRCARSSRKGQYSSSERGGAAIGPRPLPCGKKRPARLSGASDVCGSGTTRSGAASSPTVGQ